MSFSSLKRKFHKIYNKHLDFISDLEENNSGSLTILYCSYILLEQYFISYDDPDFPEGVIEYFSDEDELFKVIEFFEKRINIIKDLYDEYDQDTFEELAPVLYYKLEFEELLEKYEVDLIECGMIDRINKNINELDTYIQNGENITDDQLDEIELDFASYNTYVDVDDTLSKDIFAFYLYMKDELIDEELEDDYDEDDYDEEYFDEEIPPMSLEFLKNNISMMLDFISREFGEELLSLKRESSIYKEIIRYKKLVGKCAIICDCFSGEIEELNEKFGFDFPIVAVLSTSLYFNTVSLIKKDLKIESCSAEQFKKYKMYAQIKSALEIMSSSSDKDDKLLDDVENASDLLFNDIVSKNIPIEDVSVIYDNVSLQFNESAGLEYETIDETINYFLQLLSNLTNEYY